MCGNTYISVILYFFFARSPDDDLLVFFFLSAQINVVSPLRLSTVLSAQLSEIGRFIENCLKTKLCSSRTYMYSKTPGWRRRARPWNSCVQVRGRIFVT